MPDCRPRTRFDASIPKSSQTLGQPWPHSLSIVCLSDSDSRSMSCVASHQAEPVEDLCAMTADGATPQLKSLADRAAKNVSRVDRAGSRTAMSHTAVSADAGAGDAQTPFYDHLMSMIHATALENRRAAQNDEVYAVSRVAHPRWRIRPLIPCIAGLIVVAAIGRVLLVSEVSQRQPPAATADADHALEERSRVAGNATTTDELVERPVRAAEPDGLGPIGVEGTGTAEDGNGAGVVVAAKSDERPLATSVAGQPIENLGSGVETRGDGPAVARASAEATHTDPIAPATAPATGPTSEQPPQADAPSSLPSAVETGSVERANDPAGIRIARVVSDVRMRAGPSNGEAVLATISRGRPVEVINCRQWCEVVFAGQRGWVYKGFLGAIPGGR